MKIIQKTVIIGSESNLTIMQTSLYLASIGLPTKIQQFIDSNPQLSSSPLIVDLFKNNIQLFFTSKENDFHADEFIS